MNLNFEMSLKQGYKSNSQIARVLTEGWVTSNAFCPACGNYNINKFGNNKPVNDFYCSKCGKIFELKSKSNSIGKVINDGAYSTMIEKINNKSNPDFFFLSYSRDKYEVNDFLIIPRYFFIPNMIIKRKPLALTAQRAGWVGCNINLKAIPENGKVFIVKDKQIFDKEQVVKNYNKSRFLDESTISNRGWIIDIMMCIDRITNYEFTLDELYKFETELQIVHPDNHNIKAKIRQQLQLLRDKNVIEFLGNGKYRKI